MVVKKSKFGGKFLTPNEYKAAMVEALERRFLGDKLKAEALQRVIFNHTAAAYYQATHNDPSEALNHALRQLSTVLRGRIARRENQRRNDPRSFQLMSVLGSERFKEVTAIVRTIKCLQLSKIASARADPSHCSPQRSLPTVIPSPSNQLFFHNQLVEVVEHTPIEALADQDWDSLIDQAKEDLHEYREWSEGEPEKQSQTKSSPITIDFHTSSTKLTSVLIEDEDDAAPEGPLTKRRRF